MSSIQFFQQAACRVTSGPYEDPIARLKGEGVFPEEARICMTKMQHGNRFWWIEQGHKVVCLTPSADESEPLQRVECVWKCQQQHYGECLPSEHCFSFLRPVQGESINFFVVSRCKGIESVYVYEEGQFKGVIASSDNTVTRLEVSPDGNRVLINQQIWDKSSNKMVGNIPGVIEESSVFTQSGRLLLTREGGMQRWSLWRPPLMPSESTPWCRFQLPTEATGSMIAASHSDDVIAYQEFRQLILFDLKQEKVFRRIDCSEGFTKGIQSLSFDGQRFIARAADQECIWTFWLPED